MKFNCKFALVAATVLTVAPILSFPNITTTVQATTKKAQAAKNTIQVNKAPIIYDRAGNYNSKYHQNIKAGTHLKYSGKTYIIQQRFAAGIPVPTSRIIGGKLYYSIGKGG
ncbi:MAG: cell surface protein, partial [Lactobacillus crispatus]|nr:cell surface protein [Lactobacillus crispatus]